jgi:type II secretory pathway pseudopilin PulG
MKNLMDSIVGRSSRWIASTRSRRSESGDTLIEVLLAIVILGLASVSILLAFATTISGSAEHRSLTTMDTVLRTAAEDALTLSQQGTTAQFETCPTSDVPTSLPANSLPTGYGAQISQPQYWSSTASNFTGSCVAGTTNSPQLVQITVTSPTGTTGSISFVVNDPQARPIPSYGVETHLAFLTPPVNVSYTAGAAFAVDTEPVVAVEDAQGNIVASDGLPPVTLSLNSPSGVTGADLSGCAASVFRGVVTFTGCSISTAGTGYTLTATDNLLPTATQSALSNPINVTAAAVSQFTISSNPVSGTASASANLGPITVQEQDAYGNPTTSTSALTVNLASNSMGTANFSATSGGAPITSVIIPAGSSSANFYYGDTAAGTPTITVSGALTSDTQSESITGGPATQLSFTTSPSTSNVAGASFGTQPVVVALDSFGNVAAADSSTVSLAVAGGTSGATLSGCSESETLGFVSFAGCSVNRVGTGYTLTATDGSLAGASSGSFAVAAGQPSQFVITSSPVSGVVAAKATLGPITVQEQDGFGNPTTLAETVTLSSNSSGSTVFATSSQGTALTRITIPAGSSSTTFYYGDTKAGTPTITASGALASGVQAETLIGGAATHIAFNPAVPGPGVAGSAIPNIVVQAQDVYNNVAPAGSGTVALSFKSGTTGTFASGSTLSVTMANGVATFSNVKINTAGTYTFTATPSGITGATGAVNSTAFVVSPASASTFTWTALGGQTAGTAFSDSITAKDAFGNVATAYTGTQTITFSGPSNSPNGTGPTYPASVNFNAGMGTATGISLFDAQTTTLTATQGNVAGSTGITVSASGVTGGVLSTPSTSPTAGTPFNETISATDAYGNTNTSFTGQYGITFSGPSASPKNNSPTYPSQVTFAAGVAPASITLYDAQTTTLTAVVSGITLQTGSFVVNPTSVSAFSVANPGTQTAGTAFNETITAIDTYGNTVTSYGSTPAITFTGPSHSPNPVTNPTYPSTVAFTAGVGTASIKLVDVQATTLTATSGSLTGTSSSFTVAAVAPVSVVLASGSGSVSPGDSATVVMSGQINPSTMCSAWTGTGILTLSNVTITLGNSANNDLLNVTTASTCSSLNFGTVATGNNYVNANVTFGGSTVSWNPTTDTLTFTLGSTIGNGGSNIRTGVTAGLPAYTASSAAKDVFGNSVSTITFTSPSGTRFGPEGGALTGLVRALSKLARFV